MSRAIRQLPTTTHDSWLPRIAFQSTFLPAGEECLSLPRGYQALHFLFRLQAYLPHLLTLLLGCERGVRANARDLRARLALYRRMPVDC